MMRGGCRLLLTSLLALFLADYCCRLHNVVSFTTVSRVEFGLISLGLHCFVRLSSAGLIVVLIPGCCWADSALSVYHNAVPLHTSAPFLGRCYRQLDY